MPKLKVKQLDLKKNTIDNYKKINKTKPDYTTLKQDSLRSWRFLQMTHTLMENEVVCIRALIDKKLNNKKIGHHELVIQAFDNENFQKYHEFVMEHLFNKNAIYNLFYNIYKIDINRGLNYQRRTFKKMIGVADNVSSTNLLAVDLDEYSFNEYKQKVRDIFIEKNIFPIEISSGHGIHVLIKIESCNDEELLAKWLKILKENGIKVDEHCKNPGRVYRLPFFYNIKSAKYDKVIKSEVISGEYGTPTYTVEEIFSRFGYDYATFKLEDDKIIDKTNTKKSNKNNVSNRGNTKKLTSNTAEKQTITKNECDNTVLHNLYLTSKDIDLADMYPMLPNISEYPKGVQNMLKGFVEGYTYYQVMSIVLFLKLHNYSLDTIQSVLHITESINGNDWNSWNLDETINYFYKNTFGIDKKELKTLMDKFGVITFPKKENKTSDFCIPLGIVKPNELKVFIYLLINGESRKCDILKNCNITNNKLDRIMEKAVLLSKKDNVYIANELMCKNYIYLNREELIKYFTTLDENELAVYLYLKYRAGKDSIIQTSRVSIEKGACISHKVVTTTVKKLEEKKYLSIKRFEGQYILPDYLRESNIYELRL